MSAAQQFKAGQRVLIRFSYNPAKPAAGRVVRTKKSMLPMPAGYVPVHVDGDEGPLLIHSDIIEPAPAVAAAA